MSLRGVLLVLVAFFAVTMTPARAQWTTTPTEALALREAALNRYGLYAATGEAEARRRSCFGRVPRCILLGEGWGILQLVLLLALGVPARMRNVAENLTKNRWGQCFVFVFLFLLAITLLNASAEGLWAPYGGGVWAVGAGVGELGLGPDEEFSADVGGGRVCW